MVIQPGAATQEAVRLGLRRLSTAPCDRPSSLDCAGNQQLSTIDEVEEEDQGETRVNLNSSGTDTRMSQRWPTARSVIRDNASKEKTYKWPLKPRILLQE